MINRKCYFVTMQQNEPRSWRLYDKPEKELVELASYTSQQQKWLKTFYSGQCRTNSDKFCKK